MKNYKEKSVHIPVLLESTLAEIAPQKNESYLDLTAGYGGHARAFLAITKNFKESTLVDRDDNAIRTLHNIKDEGAEILHMDFLLAAKELVKQGRKFDIILADLGISSPQIDIAERGFSFQKDGPLDMRMDQNLENSAEFYVNNLKQHEIIQILTTYGEEKRSFAKKIAEKIISERKKSRISTTKELADLILSVHVGRWQKTHPATRTFQAFRILVNDELGQVEQMLECLPKLLNQGGRVGIITFHSLEDRIVKEFFKRDEISGLESRFEIITKKPISGAIYDAHNPRSRSAKLRVSKRK